jgi:hypothetical protein
MKNRRPDPSITFAIELDAPALNPAPPAIRKFTSYIIAPDSPIFLRTCTRPLQRQRVSISAVHIPFTYGQ